jgi:hypothetical protein
MTTNNSGLCQVKARKNLNFQQFTLQPRASKNIKHRDEKGVENIKHGEWL